MSKKSIDDEINLAVLSILEQFSKVGYKIAIITGRSSDSVNITQRWLDRDKVPVNYLYMRESGVKRHDYIIKHEIYKKKIKDKMIVEFILEDRTQGCGLM